MRHPRPAKTPWGERSRRSRNAKSIAMRNKIREQAPWLGGLFATDDYLLGAAWIDAWILSRRRKPGFYNATLDSAMSAYFAKCDDLAEEKGRLMLAENTHDFESRWQRQPSGFWRLGDPPPAQVDAELRAFGGLRRYDWERQESNRLADSGDVWIQPRARMDFSYCFGIGFFATLPCDELSAQAIDAFVQEFLDRREPEVFALDAKISYPSSRRAVRVANPLGADLRDWAPLFGAARQERLELDAAIALAAPGRSHGAL